MIRDFSDHAANERTFLAWVRTGIAITAFGFVIEKFNFFILTLASSFGGEAASRIKLEKLQGPFGHYDGIGLMFGGIALIVLATSRFVRTTRLLEDPQTHSAGSARTELILSAVVVLLIASYTGYLAFG